MKNILLLISTLFLFASTSLADVCTSGSTATGNDDANTTATVTDFTCVGAFPIQSATLDATIGPNCTFGGGNWYYYDIVVNGTTVATQQCDQTGFDLTPYLPLTSVSVVSFDDPADGISDAITMVLDVNLTFTPTCSAPSNLTVSNIAGTSADLSWTENNGISSWDIEWGLSPLAQGTGNTTITGSNPYTISGLSSLTGYDYYVRSICSVGDTSAWSSAFTFTTPLTATMITCGVSQNTSGVCYVTGTIEEWLFEAADGTSALEITVNAGQVENSFDEFEVYDGVDAAATLIYSGYGATGDLTGLTFNSTGTQMYVRINPDGSQDCGTNGYTNLDFDVDCYVPPTCPDPSTLTATNITGTSADLSWIENAGATSWEIEWGTAPLTQGTGNTVLTGSNPYTENGLSPTTNYEYYVRAVCGAGDSSNWVGPLTFVTAINTPVGVNCTSGGGASFIFSDDMETAIGWTGDIGTSDGLWDFPTAAPGGNSTGTGPSGPASGTTYAEFEASGIFATTASMVTPMVDLTSAADEAELSFYMHAFGADIGTLDVGVGTSSTGPFTTEFSWTGVYQTSETDPWALIGVDISSYIGQQVYIEFSYSNPGVGFTEDIAIDLVQVETCVSCPQPNSLSAANLTTNSADLYWTEANTATSWEVEWGIAPLTQGTGNTTITSSNNPYSVNGFSANTNYEFYVRAVCGVGDTSIWAGPYNFATLISCPAPAGLTVAAITSSSADLAWTETGAATSWEVEWDVAPLTQGTGNTTITNSTTYSTSGLTTGANYEYYVRSICGVGDSSTWTGPFSFTTSCGVVIAPYTEEFNDFTTPNCWTESGSEAWNYSTAAAYGAAGAGDNTGNGGNYAWIDGSTPNGSGQISTLTSPLIDISGLSTPYLDYWVFSNNIDDVSNNTLVVDFYDGTNWNTVQTLQANNFEWTQYFVNISTFSITGNVQVRFTIEENSDLDPYYNDILIDDVRLYVPPAIDIAVISIDAPSSPSCNLTSAEDISITVMNTGVNDTSNFILSYQIDGGVIISDTIVTTLTAGNSMAYTFNTPADLSAGGTYNIVTWVSLVNDGEAFNDTSIVNIINNPNPVVNLGNDTTICNGAILILDPGFYNSYLWYDGWTSQINGATAAGTYSGTVTDFNGCTGSGSINVSISDLTSSTTIVNATCGNTDGSLSTFALGGDAPYTFAWSSGANSNLEPNLAAGIYELTITDNSGCTDVSSYNIVNSDGPAVSSTYSNITCNGDNDGSVSTTVSGGVAPYTYLWNTGATTATISGLGAGNFLVTVTDNGGCPGYAAEILSDPAVLSLNVTSTDETNVGASNGTATASATGGAGTLIYNWSNGDAVSIVSGLAPNIYTVTVSDANGCSLIGTATILASTVTCNISVSLPADTTFCSDIAALTIDAGPGYNAYLWSTGETSQTISVFTSAIYTVTVSDINLCTATDDMIATATFCTGLEENSSALGVLIYPNPTNGQFTIAVNTETNSEGTLSIYSIDGKLVYNSNLQLKAGLTSTEIDLTDVSTGIYHISITTDTQSSVKKLIVK
ncbi:MAG: fibronectin type III domain-containing protein [Flavobacteriales bacterium]|nr:fibronectin type III domain-containing protein [Flavobacteriales bacterium]